jgi:hypothetical protein
VVFVGGVIHAEPVTPQQNPDGSPGGVPGPESNRVVIPARKGPGGKFGEFTRSMKSSFSI